MTDPRTHLLESPELDLLVGEGLLDRLRELAEAAAAASGDEGRLARRGFAALTADVAAVLPPAVRPAFLRLCEEIRSAAAARR